MSALFTEELKTTLTQSITLEHDKIYHIEGFKILIVMYNAPAGTFTLTVKSGANSLISKDFTSAEIKTDLSTSNNYGYIWKAIVFDDLLALKKGTYDLVLSSSGYSHSNTSFLGWVKLHENLFNDRTDAFVDYTTNPYGVLIYERTREDLVR